MRNGIFFIAAVLLFIISCQGKKSEQTMTSGSAGIVVDESLAPIIEDQLAVFESSYPDAHFKLSYKPENQLLNYFLNDSVRIAIMSRKLKANEARVFERMNIKIRTNRFAVDAIALIVNNSARDTAITVDEIISIMRGEDQAKSLVFDNANSSTVRYLKELAGVSTLPSKGVYALKTNLEVIEHVHNNIGAIGVIGVNWVKQPSKALEPLINKLRILGVKNLSGKPGDDRFYHPTQDNLALGLYPLSRDLYIINCTGGPGLGTGFATFIAGERGQRIVLKSGLLPDSIPPREILLK